MNKIAFIALAAVYVLASCYIAMRTCRALKRRPAAARAAVWAVIGTLTLSSLTIPAQSAMPTWLGTLLYNVSTNWMPAVLYGIMAMLTLDGIRKALELNGHKTPYHTPFSVALSASITLVVMLVGHINATDTQRTTYTTYSDELPDSVSYTIALASDIHLGHAIDADDAQRLAEEINSINPDITLLCGDIIDGALAPVLDEDMAKPLGEIRSKMGTYAIMGNHEHIDDPERAEKYLRSIEGLTLLRDSCVTIGSIAIVGRDDRAARRSNPDARQQLRDIMPADKGLFSIVMDHQPSGIDEANDEGADLVVCGHTHCGQIWPLRIFTKLIFGHDYGQKCTGTTTAIVTSGFGTWGPRVRTGSISEVVEIEVLGTRHNK